MARRTFDRLERQWLEQAATLEKHVIGEMKSGKQKSAAKRLDEFTGSCVQKALETVAALKTSMKS